MERLAGATVTQADFSGFGNAGLANVVHDALVGDAAEDGCGDFEAEGMDGPAELGFE